MIYAKIALNRDNLTRFFAIFVFDSKIQVIKADYQAYQ